MGDKYEIRGQVGAVGPSARAEGNTLQQANKEGDGGATGGGLRSCIRC